MNEGLKSRRIIDSAFLEFISNSKLTSDFSILDQCIQNPSDAEKIIGEFLKPPRNARKSLLKGSKMHRKLVYMNKIVDEEQSDETIPVFYPIPDVFTSKFLEGLYPSDTLITLPMLTTILKSKLHLPSFFALPMMVTLDSNILKTRKFEVTYQKFLEFAVSRLENKPLHEQIFNIMLGKNSRDYLIQSDLAPYLAALMHTHQSLRFLESEPALQSSFAKCIISRTFYALDSECRGRITKRSLANSNFCDCLVAVDAANDVSDVSDFFSYEHFYVIFTKFWQLDEEEKGKITSEQVASYDDGRIPLTLVRRFHKQLPPGDRQQDIWSFTDFVYFIMAVEDKTTETATRLWYRVCDLDEDGVISLHELDMLYALQKEKMKQNGIDPVPYEYIFSQMVDLIANFAEGLTLAQIRSSQEQQMFWNTFVDFKKFNQSEFKDPLFEMHHDATFSGMKEWDVFCQREYARLSQE